MTVTGTTATSSLGSAAASTAAGTSAAATDYDMFLKMLTTQLQNQDPLNPIESTDYAVQLATFSGVEQQTKTNDLLEQLMGRMDFFGLSQLAGWVGQEVRVATDVAWTGSPVELILTPDDRADRTVLVVRDEAGNVVARDSLSASTTSLVWQGLDIAGDPLPTGRYAVTLESYSGDTSLGETAVESWVRVAELQASGGTTSLVLANGERAAADAVTGLRPAQ